MKRTHTEIETYRNATIWHVATRNGEFYHWQLELDGRKMAGDANSVRGAKMAISRELRMKEAV